MSGAFPVSGTIDPQAFPFLIVDLHQRGATGSLKVEGPSYQKALYFRSGRILFGSSNDPRDQLGAILIETGTLTPEQLEEANSKVGPGNPLAKVLADTGFVSQRELGEAARAKVERILADVIAYTAGNFEFEDGVLPKGAVDLKLSTEKVVLAAVRRVSDRGFVLRHLDGLDVVLTPGSGGRGKSEIEAEVGELLARIDGRATLKQAAAATRLDEFDAAKAACALVFLGLVRRAKDPAPLSVLPTAGAEAGAGEIDLLDTAREALAVAPAPARSRVPEPAPVPPPAPAPPLPVEAPIPAITFEPPAEAFAPAPSDGPEIALFVPEDVKPVGPPPAAPEPVPSFAAAEPEVPIFVPEPEPAAVAAPPVAPTPAAASSGTVLPLIPPPPRTPTPAPVVFTPAAQAAPDTAPYIPSRTPDLSIPPAPAGVGPSKREAREWKPPARGGAAPAARTALPAELEAEPSSPKQASRPSKDDLAALDALLNSKGLEGPLQPLERPAPADRWSPQFGGARGAGGARPMAAGSGRGKTVLLALLLAIALGAAGWYYLGRPQPGASAAATVEPPTSAAASTLSSGPATAEAEPSIAPTPAPTGVAAPPTPPPPVAGATPPPASSRGSAAPSGGLRDARSLLAGGDLRGAARGFAANLRTAPAGAASVQLLIACSDATVQKALANVASPELFIVPVKYQGRDCYRLLWGLYASANQAASAVPSVPDYFRQNGASPRVLSATELRP
jgi:hypothetical protein